MGSGFVKKRVLNFNKLEFFLFHVFKCASSAQLFILSPSFSTLLTRRWGTLKFWCEIWDYFKIQTLTHTYTNIVWLSACLLVCFSACLTVCLSDCLLVWLSTCLTVCLSDCLLVWLSACLTVCLSNCLLVWLSACLLVWLSAFLTVCLSDCLLVWLSACLTALSICVSRCQLNTRLTSSYFQFVEKLLKPEPEPDTGFLNSRE